MDFPALDLARFESASAEERRAIGVEVDAICRTTGFLTLVGHGVDQATIDALWRQAEAFFALPAEAKLAAKAPYPGYPYGYLPPLAEALARSKGVEIAAGSEREFQRRPGGRPARPRRPAGARLLLRADDLASGAARFRASVARLLPRDGGPRRARHARVRGRAGAARGFFAPFIDAPISALRALNYPALEVAPAPGQIRAGAHTDYGSLTILLPQAGSRGLEIFTPEARLGRSRRRRPAPSSSTSAT